jgi:NAD-dependent deacetylase
VEELDTVVEALYKAQLVVAATGAGMSKESGIATFREAQEGLWERYNPEELATRQGFQESPARVWGWYNYRRGLIAQRAPHAGHRALAELEQLVPQVIVVWLEHRPGAARQHSSLQVLRAGPPCGNR